ncbi:MAG TPA: hypothetical protein VJ790_16685 [Dongiaceae bacterium]|nr:hypothetical protein [Dongiaceae bacterium]
MNRNLAVLAVGVVLAASLAACAGPTEEQKAAAAAARPLNAQELSQLVTGNSLSGLSRTKKSNWTEYYDPSGAIVGVWKATSGSDTGKYGGTWKLEGDKFCGDYAEDDESDGCYQIAVNGDKVYFLAEDGMAHNPDRPASLVQGKAEGI